jgi:D-3-phosphoglycerate dehydrogenase
MASHFTSKKKVLVTDALAPEALEILKSNENILSATIQPHLTEGNLISIIPEFDALIVRMTKVTASIISAGKNLKLIARAGNGFDNIDCDAAKKAGVVVMNSPEASATTTAEFTIALFLSAVRKISEAANSLKKGSWERKAFLGTEISGKTFGIIGLGRIGSRVAKRMKSFEVSVIANDPYLNPVKAKELDVPLVSLDDLLSKSDFISLHTPLNSTTQHLINAKAFEKMKPQSILVNAARGGIVDEKAVLSALESGKLLAYATDVFEEEPPNFSHPLFSHAQVVATPHIGAQTAEAQRKVSVSIIEQVIQFFKTGEALYAVEEGRQ